VTTEDPHWFKSSYSDNGGQCIEVATNLVAPSGVVPVRDSKNPGGPTLGLAAPAFTTFIIAVKSGEFQAR
jgi:hypothetical protein